MSFTHCDTCGVRWRDHGTICFGASTMIKQVLPSPVKKHIFEYEYPSDGLSKKQNEHDKSRGNALWEHMVTTHDLYLTETELSDIYSVAAEKYDSLVAENFNLANKNAALFEALEKIIIKANEQPDQLVSYITAEDSPIRKIYAECKP